jgi:hypothetical protein
MVHAILSYPISSGDIEVNQLSIFEIPRPTKTRCKLHLNIAIQKDKTNARQRLL